MFTLTDLTPEEVQELRRKPHLDLLIEHAEPGVYTAHGDARALVIYKTGDGEVSVQAMTGGTRAEREAHLRQAIRSVAEETGGTIV